MTKLDVPEKEEAACKYRTDHQGDPFPWKSAGTSGSRAGAEGRGPGPKDVLEDSGARVRRLALTDDPGEQPGPWVEPRLSGRSRAPPRSALGPTLYTPRRCLGRPAAPSLTSNLGGPARAQAGESACQPLTSPARKRDP
jgi:hypothetical protein